MARVGRPPLYNNCLDLDWAIEDYFEQCQDKDEYPTLAGLSVHLGYNSRAAISNLEDRNYDSPEFVNLLKKARAKVMEGYERAMMSGKNPAGPIFLSKNLGIDSLRDRLEVDQATAINVVFNVPGLSSARQGEVEIEGTHYQLEGENKG